jgi:hypothetical protein
MTGSLLARTEDVAWKQIDDEVVILDLRTSRYLRLNHSGALVWSRIVAGATREELVAALVRAYDIPPAVATADLERLLTELAERELLSAVGDPRSGGR